MKILGLIPARGNSKGLKGKNIYPVNGRPLIYYTIIASLKSKYITDTYVSSDSDDILEVSSSFNAKTIKRPAEYATDEASSESVVLDAINQLKKIKKEYDIVVLLQPTSPLRTAKDIDNANEEMLNKKASGVISVTNIGVKPFKSYYKDNNGFLKGVHNNESPNMRRQDLPDAYLANGAIYAIYVKKFAQNKTFITDKTIAYEMSEGKSIDVDFIEDISEVESVIREREKE